MQLYNVVVDNELTSNKLIKKGQLERRHTFIPINKIQGRAMDQQTIRAAQQLVSFLAVIVHMVLSLHLFELLLNLNRKLGSFDVDSEILLIYIRRDTPVQ